MKLMWIRVFVFTGLFLWAASTPTTSAIHVSFAVQAKLGFKPLTAPKKKMWVQPVSDKKEPEEEDRKSSSSESSVGRRSPLSVVSSGRQKVPENEVPLHLRPPRGYGDRATRVQV